MALEFSIENRGSSFNQQENCKGNKDCQVIAFDMETYVWAVVFDKDYFIQISMVALWISLECSLAKNSSWLDSCHRLVQNWTCYITDIPVTLAPVSALLYFWVWVWVGVCVCVYACLERERERERHSVECGDSFRSNCVELDSTQECTKDWISSAA